MQVNAGAVAELWSRVHQAEPAAAGHLSGGRVRQRYGRPRLASGHGNLRVMSERDVLSLRSIPGLAPISLRCGSMARTLLKPRRRVPINWRRLSACSETELAVPKREEVPRVLAALVAAAQRAIEKSHPVIAKMDEILAKRSRAGRGGAPEETAKGARRHMPRSSHTQEVIWTITESQEACERVWFEFAELKVTARVAIAESRELMAEIDALIARRYSPNQMKNSTSF